MTFSFYNTLTRRKEGFAPGADNVVRIYACGPTVYGHQHIGNLRATTTADLLARVLRAGGCDVRLVSNITDVGHLTDDDIAQGDSGQDKVERAAAREGRTPTDIARAYEAEFVADTAAIGIAPPAHRPRATEHVADMIALIEQLIASGHAYEADGNVFFDVASFPAYGALSGNTLAALKVGARLAEPHPSKRSQWDFALWLAAPEGHIMRWPSPWGVGYPGWHIECSAMSMRYLGPTLDFHLGGEDNIFPHHEAEIAQSESVTHQPFARIWMHTRHMLVDGAKMSKSKGNIYTLADIVARGYDPEDLRMLYLGAHYRSQMNFTWDALDQARKNRATVTGTYRALCTARDTAHTGTVTVDTTAASDAFFAALADDLNTPEAMAVLFCFLGEIRTALAASTLANTDACIAALDRMNAVLGLTLSADDTPLPDDIAALVAARDAARTARDWAAADATRDQLVAAGYTVEDTPAGTRVVRA